MDAIKHLMKASKTGLFRYWVYRRMYTPYEEDRKFMDETPYEETTASFGKLLKCSKLGTDDLLLEFEEWLPGDYGGYEPSDYKQHRFFKLSELRLELVPYDGSNWDDEDSDDEFHEYSSFRPIDDNIDTDFEPAPCDEEFEPTDGDF